MYIISITHGYYSKIKNFSVLICVKKKTPRIYSIEYCVSVNGIERRHETKPLNCFDFSRTGQYTSKWYTRFINGLHHVTRETQLDVNFANSDTIRSFATAILFSFDRSVRQTVCTCTGNEWDIASNNLFYFEM